MTGPDAGTAAGVAPGAVHEVGHETSPHTAQSSRSGNGAPATPSTSQRAPSPSSPGPSSSYSDYYRQANTPYVRPSTPPTADAATQVGPSIPDPTAQPSTSYNTTALDAPSSSTTPTAPASDDSPEVSAAFARAQAALTRAELNLDDMQRLSFDAASLELRGAPPSRWQRAISIARSVIIMGALAVGMLASHAFGLAVQWAGATVGAALIAGWGLRKGSLSHSGAIAAFCVGCGTLGSSLRFGTTLIAFFLSSSKLTTYKEEMKEGLEENAKKGGQRTWVQVLCNSLVPTVLAIIYGVLAGCVDLPLGPPPSGAPGAGGLEPWRAATLTGLMGGFLGYFACCCGDTWASELGPLSADTPRLITTLRPVRRGTNGGVTLLGLSASIMGGMFVGLVFYLSGLLSPTLWIFEHQRALAASQWRLIPLGLMAGLFGSVLDSLLGATLQFSGYNRTTGRMASRPGPDVTHISGLQILDNNAVNAVSASATAALTALVALKTFGF